MILPVLRQPLAGEGARRRRASEGGLGRIHPDKNRRDVCATRGNDHFFERNAIPNDTSTRPRDYLISFQQHSGFVPIID